MQLWNQRCWATPPSRTRNYAFVVVREYNVQFSCLFKNKIGLKSKKTLLFFSSRGNYVKIHKKAKLATWNPRMVLMCWPRKINCKVLWGLLKTSKNNWWAVLIRLGCYFPPLKMTTYTVPQNTISTFLSWLPETLLFEAFWFQMLGKHTVGLHFFRGW